MTRGDLADALPLYDRGLSVTETDPGLTDLGLLLQINKAATLFNLDRHDEALTTAERARQLADQVGTAVRLGQAHCMLSQLFFEIGRWDDALAEIETVPTDLKEPGAASDELGISATIKFHRNEPAVARDYLVAAEPHARRVGQRSIPPLILARSLDREQAGDLPERWPCSPPRSTVTPTTSGRSRTCSWTRSGSRSRPGTRRPRRRWPGRPPRSPTGRRYRIGRPTPCTAGAWSIGTPPPCSRRRCGTPTRSRPLPRAKALEAAAECLVEVEDRVGARLAFEQAMEVYEFLGAEADLNRVQAEFRGYGIRRGPHSKHRRAQNGWESLTDAELKVAAFVEEGLSNPDIAARLMLSRRTVATHVSHILKKLEVATRTDIARESALRVHASQ